MRGGAQIYENRLFIENHCFNIILVILGPSRPQKWIRLEFSRRMVLSGGLEVKHKAISWKIYGSEGGFGAGSESKPKQKQKHPKQKRFEPGRWVGLDPFAPSHNKTLKNCH